MVGGFNRNADSSDVLIKRQEVLAATVENLENRPTRWTSRRSPACARSSQEISDILASRAKVFTMPPVVVAGARAAEGQEGASAAGEKLDERLKELVDERQALERAMAAFDVKGNETVEQVERQSTPR
jgi:hypothetical protein